MKHISRSQLPVIPIGNPIQVSIFDQLILISPKIINAKMIFSFDISKNSLCGLHIDLLLILHELGDQTNEKTNIKTNMSEINVMVQMTQIEYE